MAIRKVLVCALGGLIPQKGESNLCRQLRRGSPVLLLLLLVAILALGSRATTVAMPASPVDETAVPHYFGPFPNWANSPLTLPDAQVVITGSGAGATAEATVGANGAITDITVTDGGSGYSNAKVDIVGSGTGATAQATIVRKGAVVAVTVDTPGTGYTAPTVSFTDGAGSGASATAYGGVENNIQIIDGGSGYGARHDRRQRRDHSRGCGHPRLRVLDGSGHDHP